MALCNVDDALRAELRRLSRKRYWSYAHEKVLDAQPFFEYPARMVAPVQRDLIALILRLQPEVRTCFEPFAGSGTVLLECSVQGVSSVGQDVNPLSILLCRSRASLVLPDTLEAAASTVTRRANRYGRGIEVDFPGIGKWFRARAAKQLSLLARSIGTIESRDVRRFLWVCLAETVRRTSNSRTSTYKLHIRPPDEISKLPLPLDVFNVVCRTNIDRHRRVRNRIVDAHAVLQRRPSVIVQLRDSRLPLERTFDMVVTSPPYGDNATTVPYGQQAYLPLQWIAKRDIDSRAVADDFLYSTHEIDRRSLGGDRYRGDYSIRFGDLLARSPSLVEITSVLAATPTDRMSRVLSFLYDLDEAASSIASSLAENGYAIWTIGNRRVGGIEVPLDQIMRDLFETHRLDLVCRVTRRIPTKRMAPRNSIAETMSNEKVLVFRKAGNSCP